MRPVLLAVDDDPGMLALVDRYARTQGFEVVTRSSGAQALSDFRTIKANVALVDLRMPDVDGLAVLKAIREADPACETVLMSAFATVDSAIEAVKLGALDYLRKPLDFDRLGDLLKTVQYGLARRQRLLEAEGDLAGRFEFYGMIGRSPVMQELFDMIRRLAPHARIALIAGETGTGKELVAHALHKLGPRRSRRFVAFNCSAIVDTLFESEFFGHTRGAFTGATTSKTGLFERADGGTLFLDEVGELPLPMQAKLLRVVEYGEVQPVGAAEPKRVDVHLIAATNRDLASDVRSGRFRQDLYYRLHIIDISLPPLRERREDIPYLTAAFIREFAKRFDKPLVGLSPGAERLLQTVPWPGNIRELRHALERACMMSEGRLLTERDVQAALRPVSPIASVPAVQMPPSRAPVVADRDQIMQALQQCGGNRSAAARELGLSRRALYRRLDSFGLR